MEDTGKKVQINAVNTHIARPNLLLFTVDLLVKVTDFAICNPNITLLDGHRLDR